MRETDIAMLDGAPPNIPVRLMLHMSHPHAFHVVRPHTTVTPYIDYASDRSEASGNGIGHATQAIPHVCRLLWGYADAFQGALLDRVPFKRHMYLEIGISSRRVLELLHHTGPVLALIVGTTQLSKGM